MYLYKIRFWMKNNSIRLLSIREKSTFVYVYFFSSSMINYIPTYRMVFQMFVII